MKMVSTNTLAILLIVTNMPPSKCVIKDHCNPALALENNPHNLTFIWKTNNSNVRVNVESHDSTIGFCEMSTVRCISMLEGLATILLTNISEMYQLTVIIKNISRDPDFTSEGYWTLRYNSSPKEFMSCTLKVLYMPRRVTFESYRVNDAVQLNCSTQMIYPKAKCRFTTNDIEMNKHFSKLAVSYKHSIITGRVIYFRSSCEVFISLSSFRNESYNVSVTIYPDGIDTDLTFGTTTTSVLELGHPRVILRDCPQVIDVGTSVTCTCEQFDLNLRNVIILWQDIDQQVIVTTSNILHFNVSENSFNYNCVIKNVTGGIIDKVIYRHNIIVRSYNLTCQKEHLDGDKVMIVCSAFGVYPEPKCKFIAYDSTGDVKVQTEIIASQISVQLGNIIQYRCACNISKSAMQQDLRVLVTMHSHFPGLETEVLLFGANVTILQDRCELVCHNEEHFKILFIIFGTLVFVAVLIVICVFLYKKGVIWRVWRSIQGKAMGDRNQRTPYISTNRELSTFL